MRSHLEHDIGHDAGRINIYMVDLVDGGIGRGRSCGYGTGFVAISSVAGEPLLAHEIGHNFGLDHIDTVADFDDTNVMHSASDHRQYFTEGQLFRAHMAPLSVLNTLYNARPTLPRRDCPAATSNDTCPALNKRIWADGTFLPN